jgi:hypothetical protein
VPFSMSRRPEAGTLAHRCVVIGTAPEWRRAVRMCRDVPGTGVFSAMFSS